MSKTLIALAAALSMGVAIAQTSGTTSAGTAGSPSGAARTAAPEKAEDPVKAMKKQADADYKMAKDKCKSIKGDEKKVCEADAKAAKAKADADVVRAEVAAKASKDTKASGNTGSPSTGTASGGKS